jgi:hypothetical protein
MRYLPMIVGAGLLSAGLLAGSGPTHAAMPTLALDQIALKIDVLSFQGQYLASTTACE